MPVLRLSEDMMTAVESSESGKIDGTRGPGVAYCYSADKSRRADIYLGLKLDGLALYQNISSVLPNIKMQFALKPVISCQSDVLVFNADEQSTISIQVHR